MNIAGKDDDLGGWVNALEVTAHEIELLQKEYARMWREAGPAFRRKREAAGLFLYDVGDLVGRSKVTVLNVEKGRGRGSCGLDVLGQMARLLDDPDEARRRLKVLRAEEAWEDNERG